MKSTIKCVYSFCKSHSTLASLLMSLSYSSFSNIYYTSLHIFPYPLSLQATSNSSSPILSSFIFLYIQPLVHHNTTRLSLFLTPHPSVYISFLLSTQNLPLCLYSQLFLFFLVCLSQNLLLLLLINYESIILFYFYFLLQSSTQFIYLSHFCSWNIFQDKVKS